MVSKEQLINKVNQAPTDQHVTEIVRKYLLHGLPFVFDNREEDYFEFRNTIAKHFGIGFHEVFIVGSSKLGYSYHKDSTFSLESDIDVVLVNENLFESFYYNICEYQYGIDNGLVTTTQEERTVYNQFLKYLVKGWMRPDKLPPKIQNSAIKSEWFNFFESISYGKSPVGNYKVSGGLFKNYQYLEKYYTDSIYKALKK